MEDKSAACDICRRQVAKYTCPRCNAPYCSLNCFRAQSHADCSEGFYKREVETEIRVNPAKSRKERDDMLQLLQRFEEVSAADEPLEDAPDDEDDLAARLQSLDLDTADFQTIWETLNEEERSRFMGLVQDKDGIGTHQLLVDAGATSPPWWKNEQDDEHRVQRPRLIAVEAALVERAGNATGPPLLYNVLALLLSYSHALRTFGIATLSQIDSDELLVGTTQLLTDLAPFVFERRSTSVLASVEEALQFLWSRIDSTPEYIKLLVDDARYLLLPVPVAEVDDDEGVSQLQALPMAGQHQKALRALGDLHAFASPRPEQSPSSRKLAHVPPKLQFYAAQVVARPMSTFAALRLDLEVEQQRLTSEGQN